MAYHTCASYLEPTRNVVVATNDGCIDALNVYAHEDNRHNCCSCCCFCCLFHLLYFDFYGNKIWNRCVFFICAFPFCLCSLFLAKTIYVSFIRNCAFGGYCDGVQCHRAHLCIASICMSRSLFARVILFALSLHLDMNWHQTLINEYTRTRDIVQQTIACSNAERREE